MTEQEVYVRRIMIEKLEEMAEFKLDDFYEVNDYVSVCSVMNEIAKTLLDK